MNCEKCNKELIEGIMEIDPNIPRDYYKTIIKCPNCNNIIKNYLIATKDFRKNNPGKTFKIIIKIIEPMEAE